MQSICFRCPRRKADTFTFLFVKMKPPPITLMHAVRSEPHPDFKFPPLDTQFCSVGLPCGTTRSRTAAVMS